jgi:sugar phosphate isomerase/epimerase
VARILYNTNGFAFHRLDDAISILADLGYDGVALTPDVHHLDPLRSDGDDVDAVARLLSRRGMEVVIETGARFVLDPRTKHRPSLLDDPPHAARRVAFLERCIEMAQRLGAPVVTLWSGNGPAGQSPDESLERLARALDGLCAYARRHDVRIGLEPEPGMAIERTEQWTTVRDRVGSDHMGLTLDVGHCLATNEGDPAALLRMHRADLLVVQLDDHRRGVHDHLAFGDGEVDFDAIGAALREIAFDGPLEVELSRHSATAPETARASIEYLRKKCG